MFYCLFDLIDHYRIQYGHTEEAMYRFFREYGICKSDLMFCKEHCSLDSIPDVVHAVQAYTKLTYLEICLSLGYIPAEYRSQFLHHAKTISALLAAPKAPSETAKAPIPAYFHTEFGVLYNHDCIQVMQEMADNSVDLVFADPPFNLSKTYDDGIDDNRSSSEYLSWCFEWLSECIRILKPGGSLFVYNLPKWATYYAEYLNKRLTFRSWITLDMKLSLPLNGRLNPTHYALLYYVKGPKPNVFNNQRIPIQTCRHCGGEIKDYGGYKSKMNPTGVNLSDVWSDIYPVRHKNAKNRAYNELPVKMMDRIISLSTNPGDLVFDPFGGSGTTYAVAEILGRRWIGAELGNCSIIQERLEHPEKDRTLLQKVETEKNTCFPETVKQLRRQNGFWLCEDFLVPPCTCERTPEQQVSMDGFST